MEKCSYERDASLAYTPRKFPAPHFRFTKGIQHLHLIKVLNFLRINRRMKVHIVNPTLSLQHHPNISLYYIQKFRDF